MAKKIMFIIFCLFTLAVTNNYSQEEFSTIKFEEVKSEYFVHYIGYLKNFIILPSFIDKIYSNHELQYNDKNYNVNQKKLSGYVLFIICNSDLNHGVLSTADFVLSYELDETIASEFIKKSSTNPLADVSNLNISRLDKATEIDKNFNKFKELLAKNQYDFNSLFMVNFNGQNLMALIKCFGIKKLHYAVFQKWTNSEEARKFGFNLGEKIFPSKPLTLDEIYDKYNIKNEIISLGSNSGMNIFDTLFAGSDCYKYSDIIKDTAKIFKNLWWEPIENYKIIAPDDHSNIISIVTTDFPDIYTYYDLFCIAYKRLIDDKCKISSNSDFNNYNDYVNYKLMGNYDATVYEKEMISPLEASTQHQPEKCYLFDKNCNLINRSNNSIRGSIKNDTRFFLALVDYWIHDYKVGDWVSIVDITENVKPILKEVLSAFNLLKNNPFLARKISDCKYELPNDSLKIKNLYLGNPIDNNNYYISDEYALLYDYYYANNSNPFSVGCTYESQDIWIEKKFDKNANDIIFDSGHRKKWFLKFRWPVIYKDTFEIKHTIGWIEIRKIFYHEAGKLSWYGYSRCIDYWINVDNKKSYQCPINEAGMKYYFPKEKNVTSVINTFLYLQSDSIQNNSLAVYDSTSQDFYTDQYDISDRNKSFDRGEALKEIAIKIGVAEGLNLLMKGLYKLAEEKTIFAPLYETSKRLENRISQTKAFKLAKECYEMYILWKTSMNLTNRVKKTYSSLTAAWDGLFSSINDFGSYYRNFNFKNLRLTNITSILPKEHLYDVDMQYNALKNALVTHGDAINAMAYQADVMSQGNYGPLKPVIIQSTNLMRDIQINSGENTSKIIDQNTQILNDLHNRTGSSPSEAAYLSNVTASVNALLRIKTNDLLNDRVRGLASALYLSETESKDWIEFMHYSSRLPKNIETAFSGVSEEEKYKRPFFYLARSMYNSPDMFKKFDQLTIKNKDGLE